MKIFKNIPCVAALPVIGLMLAIPDLLPGKFSTEDRKESGDRPNVLIILTDDQGYGDLSCHGNPILQTPNLDRLHDQAIRFTEFHVSGICTPTRSQLLTGVDNLRNRACQWGYGLEFIRLDIPTMAEFFNSAGYQTGQFGKWHLGDMFPHRPSDRGFQESVRFGGAAIQQTPDHWDSDGFDDYYWHNDVWKQYHGYCTDVFFNEAMRFMEECHKNNKPFLTYLATNAVHDPCFVDEKYRRPFTDVKFNGEHLPPNVQSFFGMIGNLDENIGRMEEFLLNNDLMENTIMIFMSDNGGVQGVPIYDANMTGTKGSLLEGGHRQSCFIRWPAGGLRASGDVGGLTQIQDILPTLLALCHIEKPSSAKFDGINLSPLLHDQSQDLNDRMFVVQWGWGSKGNGTVLWRRWRLTGGKDGWILHNLDSDPYQKTDVAEAHPDIVAKLTGFYGKWWNELEPALSLSELPHIGDRRANPVTLTSFDFVRNSPLEKRYGDSLKIFGAKYNLCLQPYVRNGMAVHGIWKLRAVSAGKYLVSLRRWPAEANTAIIKGLPLQKLTDTFPENGDRTFWWKTPQIGVALPVATAKARFGESEQTKTVGPCDKKVDFIFLLPASGELDLETWFFDSKGREICSAYYAYIQKYNEK